VVVNCQRPFQFQVSTCPAAPGCPRPPACLQGARAGRPTRAAPGEWLPHRHRRRLALSAAGGGWERPLRFGGPRRAGGCPLVRWAAAGGCGRTQPRCGALGCLCDLRSRLGAFLPCPCTCPLPCLCRHCQASSGQGGAPLS
jgi:hypothetical protein